MQPVYISLNALTFTVARTSLNLGIILLKNHIKYYDLVTKKPITVYVNVDASIYIRGCTGLRTSKYGHPQYPEQI
jgi:hypothetical protein